MDNLSISLAPALPSTNDKFPSDVLKWMKANAKPRMAVKLMQVCKYFKHRKFPYFVIKGFSNFVGSWMYCTTYKDVPNQPAVMTIDNLDGFSDGTLWIEDYLYLHNEGNLVATLLPKIAHCDARSFVLDSQIITLQEFKALTASGISEDVRIKKTFIYDEENPAALDRILHCIPNVRHFVLDTTVPAISSSNVAESVLVPNLKKFEVMNVSEDNFDFGHFQIFMKTHSFVHFQITFDSNLPLSPKYYQQLENFAYDVIKKDCIDPPSPMLEYPGQTTENALRTLYIRYRELVTQRRKKAIAEARASGLLKAKFGK